jgi:starch synthase
LWFRYSASDVDNKFLNKEKFCQAYSFNQTKPLISFISRLSYQKGVHLILESIKDIAYFDANFFFLGSGEYEQAFSDFSNIYKNIRVSTRFQDELSRRLFAASDFILMPSMFEPCGITQMIGMRYGCVPIVRKTGGLEETVKDIAEGGYGIVFDNPSKGEFMCAIKRAIDLYDNREKFVEKVKTVMQLDFSSETMAEKYMQIYKSLLGM